MNQVHPLSIIADQKDIQDRAVLKNKGSIECYVCKKGINNEKDYRLIVIFKTNNVIALHRACLKKKYKHEG